MPDKSPCVKEHFLDTTVGRGWDRELHYVLYIVQYFRETPEA